MAAFGRQVLDWHRLIPLTWACMARQTPHLGEQRRTTASLLRKLTTASNGGVIEELSCVRSNNYVQEPECRRNLVQCLLEKQGTPVVQGSLELERVMSSLLDMGFSNAHINELLSVRRGASLQQLLDIISEFILLGLNPEPVCVVLKKSPQLLKLPIMQMRKRSSYLQKLGLGEAASSYSVTAKKKTFVLQKKSSSVTPSSSPQLSQMAVAVLCQWKEFLLRGGAGGLIYYCATASPAHSSYAKRPAQARNKT
ncbi:transcription termination factor 4, mitochondrial isoform X1 [Homo sapiens]|nr:transcription termination factor 4, mitochondrial isoform X1 [Homo sapiens]XP_054196575.1 transcription termination factor 4, mitochondrial isoform X1 [Homo sapiens]XP_054196576.1 transcription termination factor 4, mitochondrial isoform X1 [Homo sapiens]